MEGTEKQRGQGATGERDRWNEGQRGIEGTDSTDSWMHRTLVKLTTNSTGNHSACNCFIFNFF